MTPAVPNLDPVVGGRLGVRAPFIHSSISGRPDGTEGGVSLYRPPSNAIAAAGFLPFPAGATDGGGVSHHSASPVHIDTASEPGSWAHAIPYKFRETLAAQIDRDLASRKRARLARRK